MISKKLFMTLLFIPAIFLPAKEKIPAAPDLVCQDYKNRLLFLAKLIGEAAENQDFSNTLPGVNFSNFIEIAKKNKCISVDALERQAWSDPLKNETRLLTAKKSRTKVDLLRRPFFEDLSSPLKNKLIIHELFVLNNLETDGQYAISDMIVAALRQYSVEFRAEMILTKETIHNPDDTFTFIEPQIIDVFNRPFYIEVLKNDEGKYQKIAADKPEVIPNEAYCRALGLSGLPAKKPLSSCSFRGPRLIILKSDSGYIAGAFKSDDSIREMLDVLEGGACYIESLSCK